ncbi:MAG TPA: GntR family transcriptional regulator [Chthoniobacteraceae bacterium]|nr:GntR family transcriptional regulator [Chthoniobacteraceae bacterium]
MKTKETPEEALLRAIADHGWKPGSKLPNTAELAAQLGLKSQEVHHALSSLAARGYLSRKPKQGTILLKKRRTPNAMMLFWNNIHLEIAHSNRMLVERTREELHRRGYGLTVADNLCSLFQCGEVDYEKLIEPFHRQFAMADPVGYLEIGCHLNRFSELYTAFRRPSVRYAPLLLGGDVYRDSNHLIRTTLKFLAERGRRKIAVLRQGSRHFPSFLEDDELWRCVRRYGFLRCQIREVESLGADLEHRGFELATHLAGEWKGQRKNYVPDCVLVLDDILMLGAARALRQSHLDIPREMEIVCKTTADVPLHFSLPVHRYEVCRREEARALVDCFEARVSRSARSLPPVAIPGTMRLAEEPCVSPESRAKG